MTRIVEYPYGPVDLDDHGPACGHRHRYQTLSGAWTCEDCARRFAGWAVCFDCGLYGPTAGEWAEYGDVCVDCASDDEPELVF